jgi:hypothetical protein
MIRLSPTRPGTDRCRTAGRGMVRRGSAQRGAAWFGAARLSGARIGAGQLGAAWFGAARLSPARIGAGQLGAAWFDAARLGMTWQAVRRAAAARPAAWREAGGWHFVSTLSPLIYMYSAGYQHRPHSPTPPTPPARAPAPSNRQPTRTAPEPCPHPGHPPSATRHPVRRPRPHPGRLRHAPARTCQHLRMSAPLLAWSDRPVDLLRVASCMCTEAALTSTSHPGPRSRHVLGLADAHARA